MKLLCVLFFCFLAYGAFAFDVSDTTVNIVFKRGSEMTGRLTYSKGQGKRCSIMRMVLMLSVIFH